MFGRSMLNRVSYPLLTFCCCAVMVGASHMPKLSRVSIDVVPEGAGSCELLQLHFQNLALQHQLQEASMQRRDLENRLSSLVSRSKDSASFLNSKERTSKLDQSSVDTRTALDNHLQMSSDRAGQHLRLRGGVQSDPKSNFQTVCSNVISSRSEL